MRYFDLESVGGKALISDLVYGGGGALIWFMRNGEANSGSLI